MKSRIIFFDILRILCIVAVVYYHIAQLLNWNIPFGTIGGLTGHYILFYNGLGAVAVSVLIFVSGAVLEYTHPKIETMKEYLHFIKIRSIRIYPAYWMSLVIAFFLFPVQILRDIAYFPVRLIWDLVLQFSGTQAWFGMTGGDIVGGMGWFIGLIISLYFLFPFISKSLKCGYEYFFILFYAVITFVSRYLIWNNPILLSRYIQIEQWFPLCNLLMFSLGILVIKKGWYPKIEIKNSFLEKLIISVSALSFYIFLIHQIFLYHLVLLPNWSQLLGVSLIFIVIISVAMMEVDKIIQKHFRGG